MKITFLVLGKTDDKYIIEGITKYLGRLKHYIKFDLIEIPDLKNTKNLREDQQKAKEAELLQKALNPTDHIILLDEKGTEFTSRQFSEFLNKKMVSGIQNLVFIVGGPYGFDESIYKLAQGKISLSKLTFSHQMVRLFFIEQVYRGFTILKGEPYHHD
ncbi:23S rRNA (pseudouridine1915-N3)-methyltransferase [Arcticibacter pallidicorallinus]|uniref:Ribosomal RNA large subunit methyltransferase H n=1 Tax=Arcticibacter pallidicorallinus TaxID=1259464 RepID=A0A2T0U9M5_9SPHI|nr:23S rRNA (pseudouridine(1915)-N(3))-methyltransferase RlmH [Arcticibacter pallidicorallinus]PRY54537.1 23S rRNA (pseudouridine1915-N3)-methyltransferase [Arcticibacter pallidicorallinus]